MEYPFLIAGNHLCAARLAWWPVPMESRIATTNITPNDFGLSSYEWIPPLTSTATFIANGTVREWFSFAFWSLPGWGILALIATLVTARRLQDSRWIILLTPNIGLLVSHAIVSVAQDSRYVFGATITSMMVAPLLWLRPDGAPPSKHGPRGFTRFLRYR